MKSIGKRATADDGSFDLDNYKNKKLLPARNVREITPHCCMTCKYHANFDGFGLCEREGGYESDSGDRLEVYHVCDLWAAEW